MGAFFSDGMVFTGAVALGVVMLGLLVFAFDRRLFADNSSVRIVPGTRTAHEFSYAPVVRQAAPAVVNVYSRKILSDRSPILEDPFFRRFFGGEGQPRERVQHALGSGVILRSGRHHRHQQPRGRGRRRASRRAGRPARVRGAGRSCRRAHRSRRAQDRSQGQQAPHGPVSRFRIRRRSATSCSPSAIPSASARP